MSYGPCTWRLWHQWISGPLMTVAALAVLIGIAHYGLPIPPPAPIYLTAVVCSAVVGGMGAGLISAALTLIHTVWLFSTPGALLHDTHDNALHLSMLAAAAPGLAIIVGLLKRHAGRARQAATREERKFRSVTQVEEALRASEARFRHLIEGSIQEVIIHRH
jgi:K+-sensing histidine kinase KdpD